MKFALWSIFVMQCLAALYGVYSEVVPEDFPLTYLPAGMGGAITLISTTMALAILVIKQEREARLRQHPTSEIWRTLCSRVAMVVPTHERSFYQLWRTQVQTAVNNVDVTHLGRRPPQMNHGRSEKAHFADLRSCYRASKAQIRRVERLTKEKLCWIEQLVSDFKGLGNVSLALYADPSDGDMPAALSVCRVDDTYGWIIAMAEHESTSKYRDLMLTGAEGIDLIRRYFQERLWNRSIVILDHGEEAPDWKNKLPPL